MVSQNKKSSSFTAVLTENDLSVRPLLTQEMIDGFVRLKLTDDFLLLFD